MPNTCSICRHNKREEIEAALVAGRSLRDIAGQFSVSKSAVERHQHCIAEMLREARHRREIEHAVNVDELIRRAVARVGKLMDALDDYLTDPVHQDRYFVGARSEDIEIVATERVGDKDVRRKKRLSEWLREFDQCGLTIQAVESRVSDPRKMVTDTVNALNGLIDRHARLNGLYQQDRQNEQDYERERERFREIVKTLLAKYPDRTESEIIADLVDEEPAAAAYFRSTADGYVM